MEVIYCNISDLKEYKNNPKIHSKEQISKIAGSIKEFGFINPILIDNNKFIVCGHGRFLAAKKLELKQVPVILVEGLTETQINAYRIADNKLADSKYDDDLLKIELLLLQEHDFPLTTIGFDLEDIEKYKLDDHDNAKKDIEENLPDNNKKCITEAGDIWVCGRHRIMCGSSLDAKDIDKLLNGHKCHLMITDPPYGVNLDPMWRKSKGVKQPFREKIIGDDNIDYSSVLISFDVSVAYIWHAGKYCDIVANGIRDKGFDIISQIIWVKQNLVLSRGDYHWQHEPCWYAVKNGSNHHWNGSRTQTTILNVNNFNPIKKNSDGEMYEHASAKPVEIFERFVLNNSLPRENICDPFGGTGHLLLACQRNDRNAFVMEIFPKFCDVCVRRTIKESGLDAINQNGESFLEKEKKCVGI